MAFFSWKRVTKRLVGAVEVTSSDLNDAAASLADEKALSLV